MRMWLVDVLFAISQKSPTFAQLDSMSVSLIQNEGDFAGWPSILTTAKSLASTQILP